MVPNSDIDHLIILYLTNGATERQKAELQEWIDVSPVNKAVFEHVRAIWMQRAPVTSGDLNTRRRDHIWNAGTKKVSDPPEAAPTASRRVYWVAVAATLLILAIGSWVAQKLTTVQRPAVAFVEKISAAGERSMYILPDGTEVWLNGESRLRYPDIFSDTMRGVELNGEAFFDVAHDKNRPFIVNAAGTSTEALGTAFNVEAFETDLLVKVALLEGSVRVRDHSSAKFALLSPGEQLLISREQQQFVVSRFDYEKSFGWKDGILVFDGDNFETFCDVVRRSYGVNITVIGKPAHDWNVRARYANERLRTVMRDISFAKNFTFELKDKELIINFKAKPMI